ncbi:hypothetical protein ACVXHA_22915, partial [Escherichia coli]
IIKPLAKIAGVTINLTTDESHKVMSKLYYPEVKELKDKHYVELFWNKVYYFWVFFNIQYCICYYFNNKYCQINNIFSVTGSLINLWLWIISLSHLTSLFS